MFDFYYGNEAEQFSFLRVPKFLFTDKTFADVSNDAKILYSFLLDRMSLSVKSGWLDELNRVYIIFTHEKAQEVMGCGSDKCTKIFKELENIGLIVRVKRGMGKPALIYVKNFVSDVEETDTEISESETTENQESRLLKSRSQDYGKSEVKTSEKSESRVRKIRSQDSEKIGVIKTDNIKTEKIKTDCNQSNPSHQLSLWGDEPKFSEEMSREDLTEKIKEKIGYDILKESYSTFDGLVDEITELIVDVVSGQRKVRVTGKPVPEETAARKFLSLSYEHVAYVLGNISVLENKITKPDVYICTSLYNALFTLNISSASGFTAGTGLTLSSSAYSQGRGGKNNRKSNGNTQPSYDLAAAFAED